MSETSEIIKPGNAVRVNYGGVSTDYIWHIVNIFTDYGCAIVVYRHWVRSKQTWIYHVDTLHHFEAMIRDGMMKRA